MRTSGIRTQVLIGCRAGLSHGALSEPQKPAQSIANPAVEQAPVEIRLGFTYEPGAALQKRLEKPPHHQGSSRDPGAPGRHAMNGLQDEKRLAASRDVVYLSL